LCISDRLNYTCLCDYPFYGKNCENYAKIDKNTISKFISYGPAVNDLNLPKNDDDSYPIANININFFGRIYSSMNISTNGYISFLSGNSIPEFNSSVPGILPFNVDLNTNKGGQIYYRVTKSPADLDDVHDSVILLDFKYSNFYPKRSYIITWSNVSCHCDEIYLHTFQLVIVTDDINTFLIYNYDQLKWPSITPKIGYNAGIMSKFYLFTKSFQNLLTESNVDYPGKWVFKVDE
jgi:hypothetical protein